MAIDPAPPDPVIAAVKDQPALALAIFASAVAALRLLVVSRFQADVALALLSSAGLANVLIGTALGAIPYLAPGFTILAFRSWDRLARAGQSQLPPVLVFGAFSLIATAMAPMVYIGIVAGIGVVFWIARRVTKRPIRRDLAPGPYWFTVAFVPMLFWSIYVSDPWLPQENLSVGGVETSGYVTGVDSRWTYVLADHPRSVVIYETDEISERTICQRDLSVWSFTLSDLLPRTVSLPVCVRAQAP